MSDAPQSSVDLEQVRDLLQEALREKKPVEEFIAEVDELIGREEPFDEAVRAAWLSAAPTFTASRLLSGLIIAYNASLKDEEA